MTKTFRDLGVHDALCDALEARGITHPFPIQELTLPLALDGNDLIGQARTGTGKTLAFGLPLLQRIDADRKQTQALVIAPTRELANQVHEDLSIGSARGLTSVVVYGGTPYEEQIEALQGGAHVVVGTPGRLLDHLNRGNLDLSEVTQLVLDEADEMLDMGFLPDVERLIEACKGDDRHTMLFSATMPTAIVRLARRYMVHPTFTRADHEEKHTAPLVTQHFFQVHRMDKPRVLARILQAPNRGGVYVFVRTKHMADRLVNELEDLGTPAIPIHGDLRQTSREKNLERFRTGKATVLVATEVAARGLDVSGVTHVVNYDCPDDEKMYLHRIGRTARAGEAGVAVTFAEFNEADRLNVIRKKVGATDTEVLPIFSTSPELIELFDLPEEKPWDAQVRETVEGSRTDRRDKARSDGRPKNRREQEGKGDGQRARRGGQGRSEAPRRDDDKQRAGGSRRDEGQARGEGSRSRNRGGQRSTEKRTDEGADQRRERRADDRRPDGRQSDRGDRVRTRTRTRDRDSEGRGGAERSSRSSDPRGSADDRSSDRGDRGDGGGRTRARGGARARSERPTERGAADRSGDGRSSDEPAKGEGGSGRRRGDQARGERGSDRPKGGGGERGDQGGDRRGQGRKSSGRSGGGDKNRGGKGNGRGGRKGGGNDGSSGQGRSGGNGDRTVSYARRGEEARGEGHPQLARRVKVEKLP